MTNGTIRQRGSIKVFVVVGAVLALAAFGVLYGAKQVAMKDQTPPMEVPVAQEASLPQPTAEKTTPKKENKEEKQAEQSAPAKDDAQKTTHAPAEQRLQQTPSRDTASATQNPVIPAVPQTGPATPPVETELPHTGPRAQGAVVIALIVAAATAFVRSRRLL